MQSVFGRSAILVFALAAASCTDSVRQGTGSSFLIVEGLQASQGETELFGPVLQSDVQTRGSVVSDTGQVTFSIGLKDPGRPTTPTQNLAITVDRYRVRYVRADGRNTPGVDVPFPFEGAFTVTVAPDEEVTATFTLVRHVAKREAPLGALAFGGPVVSTIAEVTFYGRDLTGHEVSVTGRISIEFGNFADPA
jgi:hypothetical protein